MKTILIILLITLTSCVTYQDRNGNWQTQSAFKDIQRPAESISVTIHTLSQADRDAKCTRVIRGCTIGNDVYVQGKPNTVTAELSPEYIAALPNDWGKAGDALADKFGLQLAFNARTALGHEIMMHILGSNKD